MFNMNEVGKRISKLRKENNLTQVELADKLGISYQAVSNWERGDSMPDIAKLADLSQIFNVSIDELLGNQRSANIVNNIIKEEQIDLSDVSDEELKELLPIVKPEQFEKSFNDFSNISFEQLIIMAPFMETKDIDRIVLDKYQNDSNHKWIALLPFVSQEVVDTLFKGEIKDIGWLASFAPFVSKESVDLKTMSLYKEKGVKDIVVLLPFVSSDIIKEIYDIESKKGNFTDLVVLMPFMGKDFFKNFKI